ncbi:cation transporter [Aliarcobacter cibarius]|uniref:Cation transporter n=1 Tax=Aliarcobacter cibarius TaxID=255507 RepID=A0ABY2V388_9BACT|nr:cation transporter [Aliarcobacter cibarius]TLS95099.1 cation transporter [Aliarcobacter cibarius]TLS95611.1 cation transporter [Aliarcobacter cibarius]
MNKLTIKKAIIIVALLNFIYFFIEFFIAINIHSVSLFADSIDFLEDAFTNFLILLGLFLSLKNRIKIGYILIAIILIPSMFTLYFTITQFVNPVVPEAFTLFKVGFFGLLINLFCAFLMTKFNNANNSLLLTAYYTARNDAYANFLIMIASLVTFYTFSHYPDLIVGILIFLLKLDASKAIYIQMKKEHSML